MDESELRAFTALAREQRFTRAARSLGVSQPTLSRLVQRLEKQLGAKLVVRAPQGVVLTDAGERFLSHAERALASIDSGIAEVSELAGEPRGEVKLGALPTINAYVLPPVVAAFHKAHPAVKLIVHEGFSSTLEAKVVRGELDLAIVQHPPKSEEVSALFLWSEAHWLAVPPNHRLAGSKKPIALQALIDEHFVVIPGMPGMRKMEEICAAAGKRPQIALETENLESVRRMIEAGLGISLVPALMARDKRWRVDPIPIAGGVVSRDVGVVHRGAGYLTAATRALRNAIVAYVKSQKF
ncbi:LysR family transcriptional regulator [Pendulispora albinea]|uniref:LysR family transcriptional regulator n=1 Tax=Pendulispora albinea TaxID=2741071 RepID=A0ABZ2LZM3_9BACT